jgi:hypothetical protein
LHARSTSLTPEPRLDGDNQEVMEMKVVNNDKFILERIENFLTDEDHAFSLLEVSVFNTRMGKVVMALVEFDAAFGGVDAKI